MKITLLLCLVCAVNAASASAARTTTIRFVRARRFSTLSARLAGPIQVRADAIVAGGTPGTTLLAGHAVISAKRADGSVLHFTAEEATVETALVEVQLEGSDDGYVSVYVLSSALKRFPSAPALRVTWTTLLLGLNETTTVLYNRKAQTLSYRELGGDEIGIIDHHIVYSNVTDVTVQKLDASHPAFFETLPHFGAKVRVLSSR